ncbi:Imm61 family immunity protein [Mycobacterium basiliense]|nr:Imm61 family immunity protein [Mycobacterium basiliense]
MAIGAADRLVGLSHYLDVPIDVIADSFLDPGGRPLFTPSTGQWEVPGE